MVRNMELVNEIIRAFVQIELIVLSSLIFEYIAIIIWDKISWKWHTFWRRIFPPGPDPDIERINNVLSASEERLQKLAKILYDAGEITGEGDFSNKEEG